MTRNEVENEVLAILKSYLSRDDIRLEDTYEDLGFDSIDTIELIMIYEEHFSLHKIEDKDFEKISSVYDIVNYVCNELRIK